MKKRLANVCRLILSDRNTRNLFFFLLLNLLFAFVELTYGLLTNSLGLISDSFHMFFDCSALLLGLAASLVTKWKPSEKFTYGFGRAEILAGLANGLFLLFISLFIMKEAIERTFEPPEVHHERLFIISVLGFLVNLVGIFVFQHGGQGHHHHGFECSHSHSNSTTHSHSHSHKHQEDKHNSHYEPGAVALDMNGYGNNQVVRQRSNGHRGQIMQSVFLHIVADTLGSVGVMVSAVLMNQFGWMIADPICSIFIAVLISVSVYPLLRDSFYVLMQRIPVELEDKIPDCLHRIQNLHGVLSVYETHFWTLNSDTYIGCLKLEVTHGADQRSILSNTKMLLNQMGVDRVHIQIGSN